MPDTRQKRLRRAKTWRLQGDGAVSSSVGNDVTRLENGSRSGWWTHTVPEGGGSGSGSGSGTGSPSSTSWGGSSSNSYEQTVTHPGFSDYRYYGRDYGGGSGEEQHIGCIGDAFTDG